MPMIVMIINLYAIVSLHVFNVSIFNPFVGIV
jgi:hypothetical protein